MHSVEGTKSFLTLLYLLRAVMKQKMKRTDIKK